MKKFWKIFRIALFAIVLLVILAGVVSVAGNYSSGSRAGVVMKLSRKGLLFKTWEGQLNLGAMAQDKGVWEFSIDRGEDEVLKQLNDAMVQGYRVQLHYQEKFFQFDWRGDTKYFVYKVEKVTDGDQVP